MRKYSQIAIAIWAGDFAATRRLGCPGDCGLADDYAVRAIAAMRLHDPVDAANLLARAQLLGHATPVTLNQAKAMLCSEHGDWAGVVAAARAGMQAQQAEPSAWNRFSQRPSTIDLAVLAASAETRMGNVNAARAALAQTDADCYLCMIARGDVESAARNWAGAAGWYIRAAAQAPSLPFAYLNWGAMLLAKGDRDGAIAKFALAHQKGPHFADPLELWGETLIAQNRSDLALAQFAEAAKYAPNWGRLHLKWGEALHWLGKQDEASRQFAIAAKHDLTNTERQSLARWAHV
jgi:tetratricopeptide (TPR) repeat protein